MFDLPHAFNDFSSFFSSCGNCKKRIVPLSVSSSNPEITSCMLTLSQFEEWPQANVQKKKEKDIANEQMSP